MFGKYKLHRVTSDVMLILSQWKRNTLEGATRLSSLMIQADRLMCKESRVGRRSPDNTKRVILAKKQVAITPPPQKKKKLQYIADANK